MEGEAQRRGRPWAAIGGAVLLLIAGIVVAVVLRETDEASAAPAECVEAWNDDRAALGLGRHQYSDHGYNRVEITRLDTESLATGESAGDCTVIFPARLLDPEPIAAAMVQRNGRWIPVAQVSGVTLSELGELQSGALDVANGTLLREGRVEAD
jgi:hypothetical protein